MSSRTGLIVLICVVALLFALEAGLLSRNTRGESYYAAHDRAVGAMVDRLIFTDNAEAFGAGEMHHVILAAGEPARVTLDAKPQAGFPRDGTWSTKQIATDFPFTEFLPSWNLIAPSDTGVVFHVRSRD